MKAEKVKAQKDVAHPQKEEVKKIVEKKKSMKSPLFLLVMSLILLGVGAGGLYGLYTKDAGEKEKKKEAEITKVQYEIDTTESLVSKEIGAEGGVVESSADHVKIQIGEDFLDTEEEIIIKKASLDSLELPDNLVAVSEMYVLEKDSTDLFSHPVAVTIPYDEDKVNDETMIGVYQVMDDGTLESTTTIDLDSNEGTITFLTTHFSVYLVVEVKDDVGNVTSRYVDTGFDPTSQGWFITNHGGYRTFGGNCLGMSAISKYIYSHDIEFKESFYEAYREGDKKKEIDDKVAQELAARNQMALGNRWTELDKDIWRFGYNILNQSKAHGRAIIKNMMATGMPQLVWVSQLYTDNTIGNSHAILAYRYDGEYLYVYDPNYPYRAENSTSYIRKIKFDWDTGYEWYTGATYANGKKLEFNLIAHIGTNLFTENQIMADLLGKAKQGFPDDEFPTITFSDPREGQTIQTSSYVFKGDVQGGKYDELAGQKIIHWYYPVEGGDRQYQKTVVNADGTFQQELPLIPGNNEIWVLAAGDDPSSGWAGFTILTVNSTIVASDMLVTLSWDRGLSDIDLHVTDPNGDHVYYNNMTAASGAQLDFDNQAGYGPEHYTISQDEGDQMPIGPYLIQVDYYRDHDENYDSDQSVPWQVSVQWVESIDPETDEKMWRTQTFSGVLDYEKQMTDVFTLEYDPLAFEDLELEDLGQW